MRHIWKSLKRIPFTQQLNDRAKQKGHWNSGSSRALSISALWMAETVTWLCIMLYFVLRQWRGVTSLRCSVAVPVLSILVYIIILHTRHLRAPTLTVGRGRRTTSGLLSFLHSAVLNLKRIMVTGYDATNSEWNSVQKSKILQYAAHHLFFVGGGGEGVTVMS